jgi:DNA-binding MarR family transcriptional regulator
MEHSDPAMRAILDALRHIFQEMRSFSVESEARVGLTAAQLFALQVLNRRAPLTVNELAAGTFTHQSSVSVVARRLVDKRLVRRRTSPTDRRSVLLEPTAAGKRVVEKVPSALQDHLIDAFASLLPEERQALGGLLGKVVRKLAPEGQPPPMFFERAPDPRRSRGK